MANSNTAQKRSIGIRRVNPKAKPDVSIYIGKHTKRVHVDVRLTAAEERGLYVKLAKRYGEMK